MSDEAATDAGDGGMGTAAGVATTADVDAAATAAGGDDPDRAARADHLVHAVAHDWRTAPLGAADRALCAFAEKLTTEPSSMGPDDVAGLRAAGWDDRAIHDAVQVIAYFNYINRVADALGVEREAFIRPWGEAAGDPPDLHAPGRGIRD